jgi:polysaccharide biosynthesis protein PslH
VRVLVIGQAPYPPNFGGAQRTLALIAALAERHDVVFSSWLPAAERAGAERVLRGAVSRFLWADPEIAKGRREGSSRLAQVAFYAADLISTGTPLVARRTEEKWKEALKREVELADGVLCRHSYLLPLVARGAWSKVVVDMDDQYFLLQWREARSGQGIYRSIRLGIEACRTYLFEQGVALRCARVLLASSWHSRWFAVGSKTVVPNGIHLQGGAPTSRSSSSTILFVGQFAFLPNRHGLEWFLRLVWPLVCARHAGARLAIVGHAANTEVLPFAVGPGIELAEDVPSVRPWFEAAAVSVAPLFLGAGTRVKILESIAYGTPVVSTPVGAAGLTQTFGRSEGLFVVADAEAMADVLCQILRDGVLFGAAARRGAEIVRSRFTWQATTRPVAERFAEWIG